MSNNKKLTAFEYYLIGRDKVEEITLSGKISKERRDKLIKELEDFVLVQEKKQIIDAFDEPLFSKFQTAGQYFNETYGK